VRHLRQASAAASVCAALCARLCVCVPPCVYGSMDVTTGVTLCTLCVARACSHRPRIVGVFAVSGIARLARVDEEVTISVADSSASPRRARGGGRSRSTLRIRRHRRTPVAVWHWRRTLAVGISPLLSHTPVHRTTFLIRAFFVAEGVHVIDWLCTSRCFGLAQVWSGKSEVRSRKSSHVCSVVTQPRLVCRSWRRRRPSSCP
jgi:hypothetical protein